MNKYSVSISISAKNQIKGITEYLNKESPYQNAAKSFSRGLRNALDRLASFPSMFSAAEMEPYKEMGIRKMIFRSAAVYYYVSENQKNNLFNCGSQYEDGSN